MAINNILETRYKNAIPLVVEWLNDHCSVDKVDSIGTIKISNPSGVFDVYAPGEEFKFEKANSPGWVMILYSGILDQEEPLTKSLDNIILGNDVVGSYRLEDPECFVKLEKDLSTMRNYSKSKG